MSSESSLDVVRDMAFMLARKAGHNDPKRYAQKCVSAYRKTVKTWERYVDIPTMDRLEKWRIAASEYMELTRQIEQGE